MNTKEELRFLRAYHCLPAPRLLQLEITNACPLSCAQCYKPKITEAAYMSLALFETILQECKTIGVKQVSLLGGEPLIHPDISKMIDGLLSNGITTMVTSSGIHLNDEILSFTENSNFWLLISMNGSQKQVHEMSRDGFAISSRAIQLLNNKGYRYAINWVCRHDNINDFENMVQYAMAHRAAFLNVVCNKITGNGNVESPLVPSDYLKLQGIIEKYRDTYTITIQKCYDILHLFLKHRQKNILNGCQAGISVCTILNDGTFMPCPHLQYKERYDSIMQYWTNSPILTNLRLSSVHSSNCETCIYIDKCRFCKAMSKETHDDFQKGLRNCPIKEEKYELPSF